MSRPVTRSLREQEDDLQIQVVAFLRHAWPADLMFYHVPNGGKREQVERLDRRTGRTYRFSPEAAKLKRMGVRAGVFDLEFHLPDRQSAFIELKVGKNDLTSEQQDFLEYLKSRGYAWAVCRSLGEVERTLAGWLAHFPGYALRARSAA